MHSDLQDSGGHVHSKHCLRTVILCAIFLTLERVGQEDCFKLEASLDYTVILLCVCGAWRGC